MIHVFISGASTGLGVCLYRELAKTDVVITVIGRTPPNEMRSQDQFVRMDFSKDFEFKSSLEESASRVVFLSNAGSIEPIELASNVTIEQLKENHNINFYAPYAISGELAKRTKELAIPFAVVNISSGAAVHAIAGWSAYCSSKSAVKISLECMEKENDHMTVVHVDPGVLDTDMQKKIRSSNVDEMPNQQDFVDLFQKGLLKDPQIAASEIVNDMKELIV